MVTNWGGGNYFKAKSATHPTGVRNLYYALPSSSSASKEYIDFELVQEVGNTVFDSAMLNLTFSRYGSAETLTDFGVFEKANNTYSIVINTGIWVGTAWPEINLLKGGTIKATIKPNGSSGLVLNRNASNSGAKTEWVIKNGVVQNNNTTITYS